MAIQLYVFFLLSGFEQIKFIGIYYLASWYSWFKYRELLWSLLYYNVC